MSEHKNQQFRSLARASDILCRRWTITLLGELINGASRFNDLRRRLPRMSPVLLSKRLRELEREGIVARARSTKSPDLFEYSLTASGRAVAPLIDAMCDWARRWLAPS